LFHDYDRLSDSARAARLAAARSVLDQLRECAARAGREGTAVVPDGTAALAQSVERLPGVGSRRAAQLRRLGAATIEELLTMLPWRYEDRRQRCTVSQLEPDRDQTVLLEVKAVGSGRAGHRRLTIVELVGADETGWLAAKWFGQSYLQRYFKIGQRVMLTGRPRPNRYGGPRMQMENPHYEVIDQSGDELLHSGRIVPIYHETRGVSSRIIRTVIRRSIDLYGDLWPELFPEAVRRRYKLIPAARAIEEAHFPPPDASPAALDRGQSPAHRRLIFEEFVLFALGLAHRKREVEQQSLPARVDESGGSGPLRRRFLAGLGFELTASQRRVIGEIEGDLAGSHPMHRLVQGDVGCGKTVVAACAMLMACDGGRQAALMAPTEILAEQHRATLRRWLEPIGLQVVLLTSGMRGADRRRAVAAIRDGSAHVVVGTQALLTSGVDFHRLGLVVVDEQHRFGVLQRAGLARKGRMPDVLVMTATPIPRTLALTVYGDLDLSVIDELPPGRTPVVTRLLDDSQRGDADRLLRRELEDGRQVYVVYPLVEVSETSDLKAATQMAGDLQRQFPRVRVGLLHGRMRPAAKERIMREFSSGAVGILVSTSVVEVGIDVPNATVMMVEHAERFGLAQLHQLRGRVGRGRQRSHCLLMAGAGAGEEARRRLDAVVRSQDGFQIAEVDLSLRGPGEFFGTRQSGLPELRVAHLLRDAAVLEEARECARQLLEGDPALARPEHQPLRAAMQRRWAGRLSLMAVG
jgi:ATP-dependent DNA helicase RecG